MKISRTAVAASALLILAPLLVSCSATAQHHNSSTSDSAPSDVFPIVYMGDSVAAGLAVPLKEAVAASGGSLQSLAADGGGNVVGPFADKHWDEFAKQIADAHPAVVVYQITTYDWGTEAEQRAAYERLVKTSSKAGAETVFVTVPPIRADDFYAPHIGELARTTKVATEVAAASAGKAHLVNANTVWGDQYARERDGKVDRSSDGIHTCPQGAARYTSWLLGELSDLHPDYTPAKAKTWANTGWAANKRFTGC